MAVPLEQFVKQLENSGILAGDTLKDFLPPKSEPKDAEELARELIRKKKLTKFQAEEVYRGKGKSLVLGNYVLMEKIGAGGMGQVFKARHRRMDRLVAVKLLPAAMTKDQAAIARFEREVKAAAKLRHPNIVAADDADQANGVHFLVMELVEGSDLSALVKKNGPLPLEKAVNYVLQAAKGLEFAHSEGVVHRDIKPANLLLDKKGTVKILDMGLARIEPGDGPAQADLTNTGTIMGTVDYMAPEQALDTKTADARADIYALGCSLYYLLTGKATYDGDTLMKKLLAHRDQPIPALRTICPAVSGQLEAVFTKMVAKKVEDRYQTMFDVIVDLERCGSTHGQTINTQSSSGSFADSGLTNFLNDISLAESQPVPRKKKKPAGPVFWKENKKNLLIGGGVLSGLILLAGIVISLRTKDGTLIVKVSEPDANVQVLNEEGKVEITRKGEKGPIRISVVPGKHQLKVQKDGFELFTDNFEIKSEGKESITAKLVRLDDTPAVAEAKKPLAFETPGFKKWMKGVVALPAEEQVEAVAKKLQELNPDFDGKVTHQKIEDGVVAELHFPSDNVIDISPVQALAGLKILICNGSNGIAPDLRHLSDLSPLKGLPLTHLQFSATLVSDLSPLKGMPLTCLLCNLTMVSDLSPLTAMPLMKLSINGTQVSDLLPLQGEPLRELDCGNTKVADLSPLKGMSLHLLEIQGTQVSDLSPLIGMKLAALFCHGSKVFDLSPLKGMPLGALSCSNTPVADLWPLQGMKLETLGCYDTKISDLSPLKGMPLTQLYCFGTKVSDLSPLEGMNLTLLMITPKIIKVGVDAIRQMKSLQTIGTDLGSQNQFPPDEFWNKYDAGEFGKPLTDFNSPAFQQWAKGVGELPVEEQVEAVAKKLQELNPEFDGKVTPRIDNGVVAALQFVSDNVTDISPVRVFGKLLHLNCAGSPPGKGKLVDLSPLKGMLLTNLDINFTQVADLSPLQGMPLTNLHFSVTQVSDLSPLKGMPLTRMSFMSTPVSDLSPLKNMKLTVIEFWATNVQDLSPLKGMPLTYLACHINPKITDLSPLKGMPLVHLLCDFKPERDAELLRSLTTLEGINSKPAAEFWKEVEEQQKGKK